LGIPEIAMISFSFDKGSDNNITDQLWRPEAYLKRIKLNSVCSTTIGLVVALQLISGADYLHQTRKASGCNPLGLPINEVIVSDNEPDQIRKGNAVENCQGAPL
jgi:hypothetical protein